MPTHVRIKPEPIDALANMSALALRNALGTQTRHSGTAYWDNGDGTGIITGDGARDGINRYNPDTDVQLPILDTSGIEADISRADSQITQITNQITQVNNQLAATNKAIDAQAAKMQTQVQAITAQATKDKAAVDDSVSALGKRMSAVETTADDLGKHVTDVQATVNGQASTLITFDQRISANASSGAATAKLASDIKQTVTGLSATLSQTTKTAGDALTQANTVQATAKQISDTLTTDYTTSKDADAKYATQAALKATSDSVSAQFSAQAKTNKGYDTQIASIQATAQGITQRLSDVAKTADSTQTTLTQYKAAQDQLSAQLSKTTSTAQGAVTAAAKAQATADGISLNLSQNYTSAKDADAKYATKAALKTTSDGITAQFSQTSSSIAGIQHDVDGIKIDATGIHGTLTQITNGQGVTNKTVKSIQDTVSGMQSTLTSTTTTANSALTNTTTLKTGLNSLNLTMSQHYQQMRAATQQGENLIPNGNADPNATPFNGWKINNGAYEILFPGKQSHVDFLHYNPTQPIPKGHTYRFSMQVRVTSGTCSGSDHIQWGFGANWTGGTINLAGVGTNWVQRTFDLTTPADEVGFYMSSYIGSAGAKTIQFKALSVIDITAAAQAQTSAGTALTNYAKLSADLTGFKASVGQTYLPKGDAANTYTTSSQVEQTAKQISAQVVSDYKGADGSGLATQSSLDATKKDILAQVSQTYTTKDGVTQQISSAVKQSATSVTTTFTTLLGKVSKTATQAQGMAQQTASMIRQDSNGLTVGRTDASGKYIMPTISLDSDGSLGIDNSIGDFRFYTSQATDGTNRIEGDIAVGLHGNGSNGLSMWEQAGDANNTSMGMDFRLNGTDYISINSKPGFSRFDLFADSINLATSKNLDFSGIYANGGRMDPKYFLDIDAISHTYPNITLTKSGCYGLRCGPFALVNISCTIHKNCSVKYGMAKVVRLLAPFEPKFPVNAQGVFTYYVEHVPHRVSKACLLTPRLPGEGLDASTVMMDSPERLPADLDVTYVFGSDDPTY